MSREQRVQTRDCHLADRDPVVRREPAHPVFRVSRVDGAAGAERSACASLRWAGFATIAAVIVALGCPAVSQGQAGGIHFCGTTHNGDGVLLEAGTGTSCGFARATYRAYSRWGREHLHGHRHFRLRVAGRRLSCNRGIYSAEVGESVFEARCHDRARLVAMSTEKIPGSGFPTRRA
jgi:hypothetical protein